MLQELPPSALTKTIVPSSNTLFLFMLSIPINQLHFCPINIAKKTTLHFFSEDSKGIQKM
jgi:hypothetical protein